MNSKTQTNWLLARTQHKGLNWLLRVRAVKRKAVRATKSYHMDGWMWDNRISYYYLESGWSTLTYLMWPILRFYKKCGLKRSEPICASLNDIITEFIRSVWISGNILFDGFGVILIHSVRVSTIPKEIDII